MGASRETANIVSNQQQASAWCVFDGTLTGTNAPIAGYGIASVTRDSIGVYTVTFDTAMGNVNYTAVFGGQRNDVGDAVICQIKRVWVMNVNTIQFSAINTLGDVVDLKLASIHIFGGKN